MNAYEQYSRDELLHELDKKEAQALQAESALKKSEEYYGALFSSMTIGFAQCEIICDVSGKPSDFRYLDANQYFVEETGLKAVELKGRTAGELWPSLAPCSVEIYGKVALTGEPARFEQYNTATDRHVQTFAFSPARGRFALLCVDITERKKAEEERQQFFEFFNSSKDLMIITNHKRCFKKTNTAFSAVLGYRETELLSKRFLDLVHPEDRRATLNEIARLVQHGFSLDFENRLLCKDGSFRRLSWQGSYIADEGVTYATARDITERKETEDKLNRIMREQQVILDSAPVAIYLLVGRKQVWSNRYAENLFQYSRDEMQGRTTRQLCPSQAVYDQLDQKAYSELSHGHEFEDVQELRRRDGSLIWVRFHGKAIDPPDLKKGTIWILEDITERKQMQDALVRNQNDLQTANELLEQRVVERTADLEAAIREQVSFSYSVSHDLRAPLRHIDSFSAILIADHAAQLPAKARGYLDRISAASGRMAALIDRLLELSRVTEAEIKLTSVDLSELATATLRMFQETEPTRRAEIIIEQGMTIQGDRTLLRQLLENLLGNAWKYTSKNRRPRIHFGRSTLAGKDAYFVRDNGVGFDMDFREKIFQAFERLHGAEFEGVGIGLATVQRIVQRHGGSIWAEGRVGQGATFYFTLDGSG